MKEGPALRGGDAVYVITGPEDEEIMGRTGCMKQGTAEILQLTLSSS